jgi:hypothetical protein
MNLRLTIVLLFLFLPRLAAAETVTIEAARDTTLIEDPDGARANGLGPSLFVGRTGQTRNGIRRGVLYFDVAAALPEGAIIESAALTLYLAPSNAEPREIRLHRLLAGWGEGASSASGGSGAPSEPGDATWIHTFYDGDFWVRSGGQFLGRASAQLEVGASGFFTWGTTVHLLQDVRLWNSVPQQNFGWILLGDETTRQTAKNFASRENPISASRPTLKLIYRLPDKP